MPKKDAGWGAVVIAVALLAISVPAVADGWVRRARNADKVDGLHAVRSTRSPEERAKKLVAANASGHLPNNIIRKAPDALRLGGYYADSYQRECQRGTTGGYADVDVAGTDFIPVGGYVLTLQIGGPPPPPRQPPFESCAVSSPEARRVSEGVYELRLGSQGVCGGTPLSVTPKGGVPLMVSYEMSDDCPLDGVVATVRINDVNGPADSRFTVSILEPLLLPVP